MTTFRKLAKTIIRNASAYQTIKACELMAARLKAAYQASGAYGCDYAEFREALWEIQIRIAGLQGEARDAAQDRPRPVGDEKWVSVFNSEKE